jgi:cyclase
MLKKRLIPVLILRDGVVVQSVRFSHTNIIHSRPAFAVEYFNKWAADEIFILDVSRDQSARQKFYEVVEAISHKCFVPLTVGGWVTSVDEVKKLLRSGADKITINTQAVRDPGFITACARVFGSQCTVVAIDVKKTDNGACEVVIDRGREPTGLSPVDWAVRAEQSGAGEIYLTSIDRDGSRLGYDLDLIRSVATAVGIPVVAFGGVSIWQHLIEGIIEGHAEAVAAANVFHYTENSLKKAKEYMRQAGIDVRAE